MKTAVFLKYSFLFLLIFNLFIPVGLTQDIQKQLLLAKELEKADRMEEARAVYESLYQKAIGRLDVFQRYLDFCLKTKDYDRSLKLILERRKKQPDDIDLLVSEAEIYARTGDRENAVKQWKTVLDGQPGELSLILKVANSMTRVRFYEDAIQIYLVTRKQLNKESLFALNLANLYAAQIQYKEAASELMVHLLHYPKQTSLIESHLRRYPRTKRVYRQVRDSIKRAIQDNPSKPGLRYVLINYYLHMEEYKDGLEEAIAYESFIKPGERGKVLFDYAQKAFRGGAVKRARSAFLIIISDFPQYKQKAHVLEGLAQCYKAQNEYKKAIQTYQQISLEHSGSNLAKQALYQKAMIEKDHLFHFSDAEKTLEMLIRIWPDSPESIDGQIQLGECYVAQGKIKEAEKVFQRIEKRERDSRNTQWIHAVVSLAETLYLGGEFERAISTLDQFTAESMTEETVQDPRINDGLKLKLFLNEHAYASSEPLLLFSRCEYLHKQRRLNEAIIHIDSLLMKWEDDPVIPYALFKKGELGLELDLIKISLASYDTLLSHFPGHMLADRALERTGWIKEKEGKKKQAFQIYESLLIQYPNSLLANEVRERIRRLEKGVTM